MGVGSATVSEDGDASERYGDDGARISGGGRKEGRGAPISPLLRKVERSLRSGDKTATDSLNMIASSSLCKPRWFLVSGGRFLCAKFVRGRILKLEVIRYINENTCSRSMKNLNGLELC